MGKRSLKKEKIYQTAFGLFLRQGYDNTSVDQIVKEAEVSKGLFFYHFKTKEQLLTYVAEEIVSGKVHALDEISKGPGTVYQRFQTWVDMGEAFQRDNAEQFAVMSQAMFMPENVFLYYTMIELDMKKTTPIIHRLLEEANETGEVSVEDPKQVAVLAFEFFYAMKRRVWKTIVHPELSLEEKEKQAISVVNEGEKAVTAIMGFSQRIHFDRSSIHALVEIMENPPQPPNGPPPDQGQN